MNIMGPARFLRHNPTVSRNLICRFLSWGFIFLVSSIATGHAGSSYFVRAGAAGSGNGSDWTNAYPTLPNALARGATYYIADGSYGGYTFKDAASGTTVITIKKATVSAHGTDTGWSNSYGDGVAIFSGLLNFTTNYWVFDGVSGGGPGSWTSGFGFKVVQTGAVAAVASGAYGAGAGSHLIISHLEIVGNDGSNQGGGSIANDGVAVYGGTSVTISYAYIHDMGRCIFFLSTQDFVCEYTYTGDYTSTPATHAEIASVWGFSIPSNRVTFRYNVFTHSEGTGGLMFDNHENISGGGMKVYGNIFYQPAGDGWSAPNGVVGGWTGGGGEKFYAVEVYNNTFINLNVQPLTSLPNIFGGCVAKNNFFYNCTAPDFSRFPGHDYNHFINSGGSQAEPHGSTASGNPFVNIAGLDFHLSAATPAGVSLPAPYNVDPDGSPRGGWSRGAFEYNGSPASTPTPAPTPAPTPTPTATPSGTPPPTNGLSFSATAGAISDPLVTASDYIYQPNDTQGDASASGRAVYNFAVTQAGNYAIQVVVNAPSLLENSFLVNVDAEPHEPTEIWDVPVTSGFQTQFLSLRGSGTFDSNQFAPKFFPLTQGTHQLIILGREANVQLRNIQLVKAPNPPDGLSVATSP